MKGSILEIARQTLTLEAASIENMKEKIDETFEKIATLIFNNTKGRLVISGIGKSAIIAQKIVATLNSTGTPSIFMHAADAIHGDLGMILKDDIVMIISKSGESPEIRTLVALIKNFGNPLIAMVGNMESFLAKNTPYILDTTVAKEACLHNLAPTTSTTAQMAMGDALAVALMELHEFSDADFARYHPGGNLGKRLILKVKDIYPNNGKPQVNISDKLQKIIVEITTNRVGATAVLDENKQIVGIITDGDIRRMLETGKDLRQVEAAEFLSKAPKIVDGNCLAIDALAILKEHNISQLLITENNSYKGIVHIHDILKEGIIL